MKRRSFLYAAGGCAAHLLSLSSVSPAFARKIFAPHQDDNVVATEAWGRLEEVAKGVWAHVATPFENSDFTTVANGGIIAGEKRVLAIEAFMQPAGATWMAEQCKALTGRWPTDVVVTHFHGDHTSGHTGYFTDDHRPNFWITEETKTAAEASFNKKEENAPPAFENVQTLNSDEPNELDLGGRTVTIVPRAGHTNNDVSIEITDPKVIWTGDLYFNRMFPNFGDATPSKLTEYAWELGKMEKDAIIVPGHGPISNRSMVSDYIKFLNHVNLEAHKAIISERDLAEAAAEFELPESLSEWMIWSEDNVKKAFEAVKRERE